jgi:hypothetical protein
MRIKRILASFVFCLVLAVVSSLIGQGIGPIPEIPYSGEVPLTPNIRPAIVVNGPDFDLGYQWYQRIVQIYGAKFFEGRKPRAFTPAELEALKTIESYVKKHTPELNGLMNGMVAGAKDAGQPITYEEVLAKFSSGESGAIPIYPAAAEKEAEAQNGRSCVDCQADYECSSWAAATLVQYFVSGAGFPGLIPISAERLRRGTGGVRGIGWFGNDLSFEHVEFSWNPGAGGPEKHCRNTPGLGARVFRPCPHRFAMKCELSCALSKGGNDAASSDCSGHLDAVRGARVGAVNLHGILPIPRAS